MNFAVLALLCAVALAGPLVSLPHRFHVPVVIGELVVGILLGRTGLRWVDATDTTFSFMAQVGFALVMFVAGTHVPLRNPAMRTGLRAGLARAVGVGVVAVPVGLLVARAFHTGHGPLYAVLIASSSASVVLPALGGTEVTSRAGVEMLVQLAVADTACIVALPLVLDPAHVRRAVVGALALAVVACAFYLVLRWAETSGRRRRLHDLSENRGLAVELRVVLTMLFTLAAIAAAMHVSVMLAGFLMGLAVTAVGEPHRLANQALALTEGLFGPVFFVWLGASLDLRQLATRPQAALLGVVLGMAALLTHGLMALTRQPVPMALVTAAQLGVPVGAVALGRTMGVLAPGEGTAMLLGALVTIAAVTVVSGRVSSLVGTPEADDAGAGTAERGR